jgi:hypothetical protein
MSGFEFGIGFASGIFIVMVLRIFYFAIKEEIVDYLDRKIIREVQDYVNYVYENKRGRR